MAKKYGLNSYTVQEGVNAQLGQAGFKELTTAGNKGDGNFVAFYVTGKGSASGTDDQATIAATTHVPSSNFSEFGFTVLVILFSTIVRMLRHIFLLLLGSCDCCTCIYPHDG